MFIFIRQRCSKPMLQPSHRSLIRCLLVALTLCIAPVTTKASESSDTTHKLPSEQALRLSTIRISISEAPNNRKNGTENKHTVLDDTSSNPEEKVEHVQVTGQRLDGSPITFSFFSNMFREQIRDALVSMMADMLKKAINEFIEPEDINQRVCDTIKDNAPAYCTAFSSIPAGSILIARLNPTTWLLPSIANGCGAGGALESLVFAAARNEYSWNDDMNEPIAGHSFRNACDNHDICYANQRGRVNCDIAFRENMLNICNGFTGPKCKDAAEIYYSAVNGNSAGSAYLRAGQIHTCRRVRQEYLANSCLG